MWPVVRHLMFTVGVQSFASVKFREVRKSRNFGEIHDIRFRESRVRMRKFHLNIAKI